MYVHSWQRFTRKQSEVDIAKQQANKNSTIQFQQVSIFKTNLKKSIPIGSMYIYLTFAWLFDGKCRYPPKKLTVRTWKWDVVGILSRFLLGLPIFKGIGICWLNIPFPMDPALPSPRLHGSAPCWDDPWPCSTSPALHCWKRYSPGSWNRTRSEEVRQFLDIFWAGFFFGFFLTTPVNSHSQNVLEDTFTIGDTISDSGNIP